MTKLSHVMALACLVGGGATAALAQAAQDFYIEDGVCTTQQLTALPAPEGIDGEALTLDNTPLYQTRGANPIPTGTDVPPLTTLTCHFQSGDKILVSASNGGTPYCGWIDEDDILVGQKDGLAGQLTGDACGLMRPMTVNRFCETLTELGEPTEECLTPGVADAVFDAKFIVDNTGAERSASEASDDAVQIPLYLTADGTEEYGKVTIFDVLGVHAVERGPDGIRYLLQSGNRPLGWIDAMAGQVWYSRLATFFKEGGTGEVLSGNPTYGAVRPIAGVPSNLSDVLKNGPEYQRYPVLQDNRDAPENVANHQPHLRISFIGAFCGDQAGLCSEIRTKPPALDFDRLNNTDILFLVDGTKSMQTYFDIVARAVNGLAREHVGNLSMQFGVSMYGDFEKRGATAQRDPMQYREAIPLAPILLGSEFGKLGESTLYIADALKDKPEPANAALLRAVETTPWRGNAVRWIIHIADHGDREAPSPELLAALREKEIFYAPIPVRGEAVLPESADFVRHSQEIRAAHVTSKGNPLVLDPAPTYSGGSADDTAEFEAIGTALRGAVQYGEELRAATIAILYEQQEQAAAPSATLDKGFRAGYADVKEAGLELFFGDDLDRIRGATDIRERTIAAEGYVQTAALGEEERNWAYFAALEPALLRKLQGALEDACVAYGDPDSTEEVAQAVLEMMSLLTGDKIQEDEDFASYFGDRDKLPLSTNTLLRGDDVRAMMGDLRKSAVAKAQITSNRKQFCRSATLLSLMPGQRVLKPYETQNGEKGDLIWRRDSETYSFRNAQSYNWIFEDNFQNKQVFLPLDFLPVYQPQP